MKKVVISLISVIVIQFVVIAVLYLRDNTGKDNCCGHEAEIELLAGKNRMLSRLLKREQAIDSCGYKDTVKLYRKRNMMLFRQLIRERSRKDDDRDGSSCPICGNDSIAEILYGYRYLDVDSCRGKKRYISGGCMVSEASKRFVCSKCDYQWGLIKFKEK